MASPKRRFHPITISISEEANRALRLMAPGPLCLGATVNALILAEVARREERARHPEVYAAALSGSLDE